MRCPKCSAFVFPDHLTCPSCGSRLDERPAGTAQGALTLEELLKRIEEDQARWREEYNTTSNDSLTWRSAGGPLASERGVSEGNEGPECIEVDEILRTTPEQLLKSWTNVALSEHVTANLLYRQRIGAALFRLKLEDDSMNAHAFEAVLTDGDAEAVRPVVELLGGMARAIRLVGAAFAVRVRTVREDGAGGDAVFEATLKGISEAAIAGEGNLSPEAARDIAANEIVPTLCGRDLARARTWVEAMEIATLAHEAGHVALGHTLGVRGPRDMDVSRNKEREADSFAASVIASAGFREQLFLGQVFTAILTAWYEWTAGHSAETTHPLGRERFENAFRSNREAARAAREDFGLTRESLESLLPPEPAGRGV